MLLAGLARIDLPGLTVRLCDGAVVRWGSDTFVSRDSLLGSVGALDTITEGVGDMVPALSVTFLPPATSAAVDLVQPGWQRARARFWIADVDPATGSVTGAPDPLFDGFLDQAVLELGANQRLLNCTVVSWLEQMFEANIGNSLSSTWHKSVWPGETGHDNASALTLSVAWGTTAPPQTARGTSVAGAAYVLPVRLTMNPAYAA